jgi:dienelactone hydrolase
MIFHESCLRLHLHLSWVGGEKKVGDVMKRRKLVNIVLLACALVVGLGCLFVGYLAYWFAQGRAVIIPGEGFQLRGRLYGTIESGKTKAAAIFFNGWSPGGAPWTPSQYLAGRLARDKDMLCLTVALRGMGSPGDINALTRLDFLHDAVASYDLLAGMAGVDGTRMYLVGESFGSYLACLLTAQRPVRAVSLRVPTDFPAQGFADVPQVRLAGNLTRDWKSASHRPSESPALQAIHGFAGRVQVVASENDEMVPRQTIQNYRTAVPDPGQLTFMEMKHMGHSLMNPSRVLEYYRALSLWLDSL